MNQPLRHPQSKTLTTLTAQAGRRAPLEACQLRQLLIIGLGGFCGAILRYLVSGWVQSASRSIDFPYGTLAVNTLGCLAIGVLSQLVASRGLFSPDVRALIFIGVLGAFTTFSTFSNESLDLLRTGQSAVAFANLGMHLLLGLGAVWLGREAAYWLLN